MKWIYGHKKLSMGAVTALVAMLALVMSSVPAWADHQIHGPQSTEVSCDGVTIKTGITVNQGSTGGFRIVQNSSDPDSSTRTWAVSGQGNSLPVKTANEGSPAIWTSVLSGNYTVKAFRNGQSNCNGIGFGDGNYVWNYTVKDH